MIKFDPTQLQVTFHQLKKVSLALGGSIQVVDLEQTAVMGKEVTMNVKVPYSVTRSFWISTKKTSHYMIPTWIAIVRYAEHIVCIERHPLSSLGKLRDESVFDDNKHWVPACQLNLDHVIRQTAGDDSWLFDGRFIYRPAEAPAVAISSKEKFNSHMVDAFDTQHLSKSADLTARSSISFTTADGITVMTPPVWKNVSEIGASRRSNVDEEDAFFVDLDEDRARSLMDMLDVNMAVNLSWVLKAAKGIGAQFGFTSVEPLGLARLMVELRTVNMPLLPKHVKSTYSVGLTFSYAFIWLLGKLYQAKDLTTVMMVRSLLKYLTTRGIFNKNQLAAESIFQEGYNATNIPVSNEMLRELELDHAHRIRPVRTSK